MMNPVKFYIFGLIESVFEGDVTVFAGARENGFSSRFWIRQEDIEHKLYLRGLIGETIEAKLVYEPLWDISFRALSILPVKPINKTKTVFSLEESNNLDSFIQNIENTELRELCAYFKEWYLQEFSKDKVARILFFSNTLIRKIEEFERAGLIDEDQLKDILVTTAIFSNAFELYSTTTVDKSEIPVISLLPSFVVSFSEFLKRAQNSGLSAEITEVICGCIISSRTGKPKTRESFIFSEICRKALNA